MVAARDEQHLALSPDPLGHCQRSCELLHLQDVRITLQRIHCHFSRLFPTVEHAGYFYAAAPQPFVRIQEISTMELVREVGKKRRENESELLIQRLF